MIVAAPFAYHIYLNAPSQEGQIWETVFGTITPGGHLTVQAFLYNLINKFYMFFVLSLFYLTSHKWWKWSLLVPLSITLFQLASVVNDEIDYVDEFEWVDSLIIVLPVIVFQTIIAIRLRNRNNKKTLNEIISHKINTKSK